MRGGNTLQRRCPRPPLTPTHCLLAGSPRRETGKVCIPTFARASVGCPLEIGSAALQAGLEGCPPWQVLYTMSARSPDPGCGQGDDRRRSAVRGQLAGKGNGMSADGGNGANGSDNKWIGKRTIRPDGVDKVTGRAAFGADFSQPGMLCGKVLRSPHPHARIKSINFDKAPGAAGRQGRHDRARTSWSFRGTSRPSSASRTCATTAAT